MSSSDPDRPVAFITGASSGIGAACVSLFAGQGWNVVGTARRKDKLDAVLKSIQDAHPEATIKSLSCDVNNDKDVIEAFETTKQAYNRLDALINNAGFGVYGLVSETPLERFRENMETNYFGVLRCTQAALPLLKETAKRKPGKWGGAIVMVSSIVGRRSFPGMTAYCSSKFALESLSEGLRLELKDDRISVSVINPSVTQTEFFQVAPGKRPPGYLSPKGGMTPDQVAKYIYQAVQHPRRNVYLSWEGKAGVFMEWLSPRIFDWVISRNWK